MSSALYTLKKNRRAPLPGQQQREEQNYAERSHTGCPPSDFELMSSMMQKLGQLERKVKTQALDINTKTRRIAVLEEKIKLLQEKSQGKDVKEEGLSEKCCKLQKQVCEMERFLNDYGMIWVGSGEDHHTADEVDSGHTLWDPGASEVRQFCMDFDLVVKNVLDLNVVAGEGELCVTSVPGGAKLSQKTAVPLRLYRDGIVMFNGPFRSYQDPSTQKCLQDLMDGFFPSELQESFPDGVIFQVFDRREEEYSVKRRAGFPGRGHTVGGLEKKPLVLQKEDKDLLEHSQSQLYTGRKLSMEQFLKKLPDSVVKGGKVISIRSSLKAHLQGCADGAESSSVSVVETPALQALRLRLESTEVEKPEAEITTLRVKSEDGEKTFILKMLFSDTISQLRHQLNTHRGSSCPPYDIISGFPQRCYSDDSQTLLACGLTPNAALLLRPRPPQTSPTNQT